MKLNEYIKKLRVEKGFSQQKMSDIIGVSLSTYSYF